MSQPDLFNHDGLTASPQGSLFDGGKLDEQVARSYLPDPADIRRRLNGLLDKARRADRMPWNARDARMWQTVFPQMANWLPQPEAEQLRLQFAQEIMRLQAAGGPT